MNYDLFRHATRSAWHRLGTPRWTTQDWEDLVQDAALAYVQALPAAQRLYPTDPDGQAAYLFGAARHGVLKGWLRGLIARNPTSTFPLDFAEWVEVQAPSDAPADGLPDPVKRDLEGVFRAARTQRTGRAVAAAKRDVVICDLLVRGYRNQGIAQALGIPVNSVKKYRREIVSRLVAEAQRRGVDSDTLLHARRRTYDFVSYRVPRHAV